MNRISLYFQLASVCSVYFIISFACNGYDVVVDAPTSCGGDLPDLFVVKELKAHFSDDCLMHVNVTFTTCGFKEKAKISVTSGVLKIVNRNGIYDEVCGSKPDPKDHLRRNIFDRLSLFNGTCPVVAGTFTNNCKMNPPIDLKPFKHLLRFAYGKYNAQIHIHADNKTACIATGVRVVTKPKPKKKK